MATYTYEIATEFNFPNITIYNRLVDGVKRGWRANANEGYVFYDTTAQDFEQPTPDSEPIPVTYYYTVRLFPTNYNMANFSLVAVPRDSVDENYIFGGGNNNEHEVM